MSSGEGSHAVQIAKKRKLMDVSNVFSICGNVSNVKKTVFPKFEAKGGDFNKLTQGNTCERARKQKVAASPEIKKQRSSELVCHSLISRRSKNVTSICYFREIYLDNVIRFTRGLLRGG